MKDRIFLILYFLMIILLTSFHSLHFYLIFGLLISLLSLRELPDLMKKTLMSVILFSSIISVSYIMLKGFDWEYILLINTRVIVMTYFTFFMLRKINLFKALSFSKSLSYILVISYSQILTFRKIYTDFTLSIKSRTINNLSQKERYLFFSRLIDFFLKKSINNSKEISLAMRSRGFFD